MLGHFRPSFEVVKDGGILNKIKPLHLSFLVDIRPTRQAGSFAKNAHRAFS
jgi:hypothetical protein